jgi:hypothetical protein
VRLQPGHAGGAKRLEDGNGIDGFEHDPP